MFDWVKENGTLLEDMNLEDLHQRISQTRGALDTDKFQPGFETKEYPYEERIKMLMEFQNASESWILENQFGKILGKIMFKLSRYKPIRKLGVKFLDIYYAQY